MPSICFPTMLHMVGKVGWGPPEGGEATRRKAGAGGDQKRTRREPRRGGAGRAGGEPRRGGPGGSPTRDDGEGGESPRGGNARGRAEAHEGAEAGEERPTAIRQAAALTPDAVGI